MLYLSPKFRDKLSTIKDNEIVDSIMSVQLTDVKPDITFVDITDKEGFISFTQINKADRLVRQQHANVDVINGKYGTPTAGNQDRRDDITNKQVDFLYDNDTKNSSPIRTGLFTKGRNEMKIGKFVSKLFPGKFNDKEIEEFVNKFKSIQSIPEEVFDLVSGNEIVYWYNCENYLEDSGTLGSSCMSDMYDSTFEIYVDNPDYCRLLILKDIKSDKILGRALVWKVKVLDSAYRDIEYFMDRIYTIKDSDVYKFIDFADEKGWAYKTYQNYSSHKNITYNGKDFTSDMRVELGASDYYEYPYMDTFAEFDVNSGNLYNNNNQEHGGHILNGTSGDDYDRGGNWSNYYHEYIPNSNSVYSEALNDNIREDESVYIEYYGYYPNDHGDIFNKDGEWYHKDDGIYSDFNGSFILKDDAINILTRVEDNGNIKYPDDYWIDPDGDYDYVLFSDLSDYEWFQIMDRDFDWTSEYSGISSKFLVKDYNGGWIFKPQSVISYETKSGEWLKEEDILALGEEKMEESTSFNARIESDFDYFNRVWVESDRNPYQTLKDVRNEILRLKSIRDGDQRQLDLDDKSDYIDRVKQKYFDLVTFYGDFRRYLSNKDDDSPDLLLDKFVMSKFGRKPSELELETSLKNLREKFIRSWVNIDDDSVDSTNFIRAYQYYKTDKKYSNYTIEDFGKSVIFNFMYIIPGISDGSVKISRDVFINLGKDILGDDMDFNKDILIGYLLIRQHESSVPNKSNIYSKLDDYNDYKELNMYLNKLKNKKENEPKFK